MSLWYGTEDAPAPDPTVFTDERGRSNVTLTVGVRPLNATNSVSVYYRVNGGSVAKVAAVLVRTDVRKGSQYFAARLPAFAAGDSVEYAAAGTCRGKQIPVAGPVLELPARFSVVKDGHNHEPSSPAMALEGRNG